MSPQRNEGAKNNVLIDPQSSSYEIKKILLIVQTIWVKFSLFAS